ncbi:MAG: MFS transporter [Akkermansiaceae bacterium]|nr:MFS transporter [Armatimonadota bacterium]
MTTTSTERAESWGTRTILLAASSLTVMAGATIAPALPAIERHFAGTGGDIPLLTRLALTFPALFIAIFAPFAGSLADRYGRRRQLIIGIALYAIAGVSGFFATSLPMMLVGRALLGLAVAAIMTAATALIADYYTGPRRTAFLGLQAAFMSGGGVIFLAGGGYLAQIGWQYPFLVYLLSLLILPLAFLFAFEPEKKATAVLSGGAPVAASTVPMPLIVLLYGNMLIMQIIFYMIPVQLPFHLEKLTGANPAESGQALALGTLAGAAMSFGFGKLRARFSNATLLSAFALLMGTGYIGIGLSPNYGAVLASLVVAGSGFGLLLPVTSVWLTSATPPALRGRIIGGLTTAVFAGQFLSPLITKPLADQFGIAATYVGAGIITLCFGTVYLFLRRTLDAFSDPG